MSNIPFERQRLPVDLVGQIERDIALGSAVSGSDLLAAIEQSVGLQLAARFRDIVNKFSIPAVKRRGRPSSCKGREDFALEVVDARYDPLLRKHEKEAEQRRLLAAAAGDVLASAEPTPSELAYTAILNLKRMKRLFPNLDWQTLRNKHSAWNNGHFHPVENDTDSEDFEAEIDRLFPSVPES
jgi:REP element-mobilizing transposase RayT